MYSALTKIRVNYSQVDQMGYVFFGNYPAIYDIGRTELLRELDMTPAQLEKQGIMLPVRNLQSKYYQPALYDELLTVKTTLTDISPLRLNFQFEIFNSKKNLINFGKLQLIFVYKHSRNPRRSNDIADKLMQKIHQHV